MKKKIIAYLKRSVMAYGFQKIYMRCKIWFGKVTLRFFRKPKHSRCIEISEESAMESIRAIKEDVRTDEAMPENRYREDVWVSVIVPVYNASLYLEKCLDSLKNQKTQYRYEVICIDDGSTDDSGQILRRFKDIPFFKVVTQENTGHSGARNKGLSFPLGKYVMFVDSDDYISEQYVEQLVACALREDADVVVSSYAKCNAKEKLLKKYRYAKKEYACFFDYAVFDGVAWGKLYRSELWEGVRFPEKMMFEDTVIFNVVLRRCRKITVCGDAYYYYRIHGNNTIDKLANSPKLLDVVWVIGKCLKVSKQLQIENAVDYFGYLLLQCSTHLFYRIEKFPEEIRIAAFKIACSYVRDYRKGMTTEEVHFNDIVLEKLRESFLNEDFELWKRCSKIYPSNHVVITKGIRNCNSQ